MIKIGRRRFILILTAAAVLFLLATAATTFFFYGKKIKISRENDGELNVVPKSVAIIMDGNGRWAQKKGLPIASGHARGADILMKILEHASKRGVKFMTLYAFSTENWKRPAEEVDYIMKTFAFYLDKKAEELNSRGVRFRVIGDRGRLNREILDKIQRLEELTTTNNKLFLDVAFSYGGRAEIVDATRNMLLDLEKGKLDRRPEDIDEDFFKSYLYDPHMVYPDLIIRTGGDLRMSNFLLWELSYSELYFTDVLWPDFNERELDRALNDFKKRKRTYGERKAIR